MKNIKKIFLLVCTLAINSGLVMGQTENAWSLEKCIDQAIQYNLQVKRQELVMQSTKQDHQQSKIELCLIIVNSRIET